MYVELQETILRPLSFLEGIPNKKKSTTGMPIQSTEVQGLGDLGSSTPASKRKVRRTRSTADSINPTNPLANKLPTSKLQP